MLHCREIDVVSQEKRNFFKGSGGYAGYARCAGWLVYICWVGEEKEARVCLPEMTVLMEEYGIFRGATGQSMVK